MEECTNSRNNKRNHGDDCNKCNKCNKCNHSDCCDCCDCSCCEGPVGPRGRTGPAGDKGDKGDKGDTGAPGDCCCKEAVKYALDTIRSTYPKDPQGNPNPDPEDQDQYVTLNTFNSSKEGVILGYSSNGDVVHLQKKTGNNIDDSYVSLCNVIYIEFYTEPVQNDEDDAIYDCSTPECCCNEDISEILKQLIPYPEDPEFPIDTDISIEVIDNNASSFHVDKVYGICNGIIWIETTNNQFLAIPLCSIFSAELFKTPPLPSPTIEQRIINLEDTVDELDQRVNKLEKK